MVNPVPLQQLIGARLRQLREAGGFRQEEIAASARRAGFDWVRGTVSMIESGRRRVTLEEFLALPGILYGAGATGEEGRLDNVQLRDLVGDGVVLLSSTTALSATGLRAVLSGESGSPDADTEPPRGAPDWPKVAEARALWRRWWPNAGAPDAEMFYRVGVASRGAAEVNAARTLRCSPVAIAMAAERAWGRPLAAERDARVQERIGLGDDVVGTVDRAEKRGLAHPAMSGLVQAHRGHATRELIEELRPMVKATVTRKGKGGA